MATRNTGIRRAFGALRTFPSARLIINIEFFRGQEQREGRAGEHPRVAEPETFSTAVLTEEWCVLVGGFKKNHPYIGGAREMRAQIFQAGPQTTVHSSPFDALLSSSRIPRVPGGTDEKPPSGDI